MNIEGDYLNYVEQNKKVIGCNSLGYNVFSDKKLLRCYQFLHFVILVIAATIFKLQKVGIPFWKGKSHNCVLQ